MTDAFKATYCNAKFIHGRKQMQIILEVPMENASTVFDILGYPNPHDEKWVAVALLREDQ
jgi:hypothetical protein